jgi:hypothetical protein
MVIDDPGRTDGSSLNAVERLLSRATETVELFDRLLGPLCSLKGNALEACRVAEIITEYAEKDAGPLRLRAIDGGDGPLAPPRLRDVLTPERLALMSRWECDNAVAIAADRVAVTGAARGMRHGSGADLSAKGIEAYCNILAVREALLDPERWLALAADVVQESPAWGRLDKNVVKRSEKIRAAIQSLWTLAPKPEARKLARREFFDAWNSAREPLQAAIDKLAPLKTPPIRETSGTAPGVAETGSGNPKRTSRQRRGGGGRGDSYPDDLVNRVTDARMNYEQAQRATGRRVVPQCEWLRTYCDDVSISTVEAFPPAFVGEEFEDRAKRFWAAARKRRQRPAKKSRRR